MFEAGKYGHTVGIDELLTETGFLTWLCFEHLAHVQVDGWNYSASLRLSATDVPCMKLWIPTKWPDLGINLE